MNIGKPRKLGKTINEIEEGDSLSLTESIEDNQLLLYLGLTNDANPLYINMILLKNRIPPTNRSIGDVDGDHYQCNLETSAWARFTCRQFFL